MKGGVILFRGSGAAARRYGEADRSRADEYYLGAEDAVAEYAVIDSTGELTFARSLSADEYDLPRDRGRPARAAAHARRRGERGAAGVPARVSAGGAPVVRRGRRGMPRRALPALVATVSADTTSIRTKSCSPRPCARETHTTPTRMRQRTKDSRSTTTATGSSRSSGTTQTCQGSSPCSHAWRSMPPTPSIPPTSSSRPVAPAFGPRQRGRPNRHSATTGSTTASTPSSSHG